MYDSLHLGQFVYDTVFVNRNETASLNKCKHISAVCLQMCVNVLPYDSKTLTALDMV